MKNYFKALVWFVPFIVITACGTSNHKTVQEAENSINTEAMAAHVQAMEAVHVMAMAAVFVPLEKVHPLHKKTNFKHLFILRSQRWISVLPAES